MRIAGPATLRDMGIMTSSCLLVVVLQVIVIILNLLAKLRLCRGKRGAIYWSGVAVGAVCMNRVKSSSFSK